MLTEKKLVIEYDRITLRIPSDVHQILSAVASEKSKSLNAEIVSRLRASLVSETNCFHQEDRELLLAICNQLGIEREN